MDRYVAVKSVDVGICKAWGWAWASIRPFILAEGDDLEAVKETAYAKVPEGEEIHVHNRQAWQP